MKFLLMGILLGLPIMVSAAEPTLVYLVRHAEKVDESRDPELSEKGMERVALLERFFERIQPDQVISTQFIRTRNTVKPIADARKLPLTIIKAGKEEQVVETVKNADGGVFLVSGHSNTVPKMIKLLGGPEITIPHDGYSNVFLIILDGENTVFQNFRLDP